MLTEAGNQQEGETREQKKQGGKIVEKGSLEEEGGEKGTQPSCPGIVCAGELGSLRGKNGRRRSVVKKD